MNGPSPTILKSLFSKYFDPLVQVETDQRYLVLTYYPFLHLFFSARFTRKVLHVLGQAASIAATSAARCWLESAGGAEMIICWLSGARGYAGNLGSLDAFGRAKKQTNKIITMVFGTPKLSLTWNHSLRVEWKYMKKTRDLCYSPGESPYTHSISAIDLSISFLALVLSLTGRIFSATQLTNVMIACRLWVLCFLTGKSINHGIYCTKTSKDFSERPF